MHPSVTLRSLACRLTLFTRPNCSLCDDAKVVLSRVWDRKPFQYDEINVMAADQGRWKDLYEFDTPVVSRVVSLCWHGSQVLVSDMPLTHLP